MHGSSRMPEIYLYAGHGNSESFCARVHRFISNKVQFAFSSDYSIDPHTSDVLNPDGQHIIPFIKVDFHGKETHPQCYSPDIEKLKYQYSDSNQKLTT